MSYDKSDVKRRMDGAVDSLRTEFSSLRTGRANIGILDPVTVDAYGSKMPLNQVASVNAPEARLLTVQVWDDSMTKAVEKAIMNSGLGLNPQTEGNLIRLPIPDLNEERRKELTKVAGGYAEQARISARNVRRDALDALKKMEKDKDISEDEQKRYADDVQKLTDDAVKQIDALLVSKEKDIMTV